MNLKQAIERERQREDPEVNITPVLNIFLILIPFLLLTAVFVKIAVLELSLPTLDRRSATSQPPKEQTVVLTILAIREDGFQLKSRGFKFPDIGKKKEGYDYQELVKRLKEIRKKYAETEDIIVSPETNIKYDVIIKVMDRCRETGFINISLSG